MSRADDIHSALRMAARPGSIVAHDGQHYDVVIKKGGHLISLAAGGNESDEPVPSLVIASYKQQRRCISYVLTLQGPRWIAALEQDEV